MRGGNLKGTQQRIHLNCNRKEKKMEDRNIYVSCFEYSRLCQMEGRMKALTAYMTTTEYINMEVVKAIIGSENFKEKKGV